MDDNIQVYRGPMEMEGPDDFDDDLNYMKNENRSLKNKEQKKKSGKNIIFIYIIIGCAIFGIVFMNFITDEQSIENYHYIPIKVDPITTTLFGCERKEYFDGSKCKDCPDDCQFCAELGGQCVKCQKQLFITGLGECTNTCSKDQQKGSLCIDSLQSVYTLSGLYRQNNQDLELEIPYVLIKGDKNSDLILYVFQNGIYSHLNDYVQYADKATFVLIDDYSFLSSSTILNFLDKEFFNYIESVQLQKEPKTVTRILMTDGEKCAQLLNLISNIQTNIPNYAVLIQPLDFKLTNNGHLQQLKKIEVFEPNYKTLLAFQYSTEILVLYNADKISDLNSDVVTLCKLNKRVLKEEKQIEQSEEISEEEEEQQQKVAEEEQNEENSEAEEEEQEQMEEKSEKSEEQQQQQYQQKITCQAQKQDSIGPIIEFVNKK